MLATLYPGLARMGVWGLASLSKECAGGDARSVYGGVLAVCAPIFFLMSVRPHHSSAPSAASDLCRFPLKCEEIMTFILWSSLCSMLEHRSHFNFYALYLELLFVGVNTLRC